MSGFNGLGLGLGNLSSLSPDERTVHLEVEPPALGTIPPAPWRLTTYQDDAAPLDLGKLAGVRSC